MEKRDEFGLPTINALLHASMNKHGDVSNDEFSNMLKMLLEEREKLMTQKYGKSRALADKFYNNLKLCAPNFASGLQKPHKTGKGLWYVEYEFQDYLTYFTFGNNGSVQVELYMDDPPEDENEESEPSDILDFDSYQKFIDWFKTDARCSWMRRDTKLLFESLNESRIPSEKEIYDAYIRKIARIDLDDPNSEQLQDDAVNEFNSMIRLRKELLDKNINESPDEFGLPTYDELHKAYLKKRNVKGLTRKQIQDIDNEFTDMEGMRIQARSDAIRATKSPTYENREKFKNFVNQNRKRLNTSWMDGDLTEFSLEFKNGSIVVVKFKQDGTISAEWRDEDTIYNELFTSWERFVKFMLDKIRMWAPNLNTSLLEEYKLTEAAVSNGVYSLYNGWVKEPIKNDIPEVDQNEVDKLVQPYIERANRCNTVDDIDELIDDIYVLRQEGILEDGEYSIKNLTFKEFRSKGYLDKLREKKVELENKEMSLGG